MLKIASGVSIIAQTRVLRSALHVEQALADALQRLDPADLGHQDAVRPGMRGGGQIVGVPGRVEAVDPDEHLAAAEAAGLHRRR